MAGDLQYFRKRLSEERILVERSDSEEVRAVHEQLAKLYAERLAALGAFNATSGNFDPVVDLFPASMERDVTTW